MAQSMRNLEMQFQPAQNPITDFIGFNARGELELNPDFQRNAVWGPDARSYLIDSVLTGYPIPPVYLRTRIDVPTQRAIREVVDGQQRLRAILEFANNGFILNSRSASFSGQRYSDLPAELKNDFLSYPITSYTIRDPSDQKILEVFARLNTFTMKLNRAELRHATYQTPLRWFVIELSRDFRSFLLENRILTGATALRMGDETFMAELLNLLINGIVDGGEVALDRLYRSHRSEVDQRNDFQKAIRDWITWLESGPIEVIRGTRLNSQHQMLMIFAAYCAIHGGYSSNLFAESNLKFAPAEVIQARLLDLAVALEQDELSSQAYEEFVKASSGQTTRVASRLPRFEQFILALSASPPSE